MCRFGKLTAPCVTASERLGRTHRRRMVKRGKEMLRPTEGAGDSEEGVDSPSKKMKLSKLAFEEWQLPLQTEVEKGGYPATCKEFKLHIQKAGGTASGYRPLASRIADTAKPFNKFSWQYQALMKELVANYGEEGVLDLRVISGAAHQAGWRHNESPPDGRGGSHVHKFFPPEAARPHFPNLRIPPGGLSTGEARTVLAKMFGND